MAGVGAETSTVTIGASTLLKGRYYKLNVAANTYKSDVASQEYVFFTNCPPYAGSCTVEPTSGINSTAIYQPFLYFVY